VSKSNWEKRKRSVCLLPVQTHVTESTVGYVKRKRMSFDLNQNCSKLLAHRPLADVLAYCSLPYCSLLVQRQIATRQIFIGYVCLQRHCTSSMCHRRHSLDSTSLRSAYDGRASKRQLLMLARWSARRVGSAPTTKRKDEPTETDRKFRPPSNIQPGLFSVSVLTQRHHSITLL
jgi:hypothetical protein